MTIDMLPDVALLKIFDLYVREEQIQAWHTLVHVCRKWRNVVFGSPCRLNLRLHCTTKTPVRETLDVWPLLPIVVWGYGNEMWDMDNIIAVLEHNGRICQLDLINIQSSRFEKVLAEPFPALTRLQLRPRDETAPVDPASFLGGSAPHLRTLILDCVPFRGYPKLLLSATQLVRLDLWRIPYSGYITPEAMANCLSVLNKLERLRIGFGSPRCRPDRNSRRPPPLTRTRLPVLTELRLFGVSEYLEDLMARIEAPLLDELAINFFHQLIFNTPQVTQFIRRTPKFKALDEARVYFYDGNVWITLVQAFNKVLELGVLCNQSDWQLSSLAQVCSSSFPQAFIPAVEHLYILDGTSSRPHWQNDIEGSQWLELLRPFVAVTDLYISLEFAPRIVPALQELVGEREVEVLPVLRTLYLEEPLPSGPVQAIVGQFVTSRQLSNHPVVVSPWERKSLE